MASNISQNTVPGFWTSTGDDVIYTFDFNPYLITAIEDYILSSVSTGFIKVTFASALDTDVALGETFQIFGSTYNGLHKINGAINSTTLVLETPFVGLIAPLSAIGFHLRVPVFNLYKGFKTLEGLYPLLPYTLVSPIKPSVLFDSDGLPYISINIKGLINRAFTIESFVDYNEIDTNMFTPIRIEWDGLTTQYQNLGTEFTLCLNSAITNTELNENYLHGGRYLVPTDKPFIASKGVTVASIFEIGETYPRLLKFVNGIKQ